jgi:hypothetical protein
VTAPEPPPAGAQDDAAAWRRPLPLALGALVAVTGLLLASRPWWLVSRQAAPPVAVQGLADLQAQQGLAVDGTRTYAERSVVWVSWYVGPVVLVIALAVLTVLAVRAGVWWERSRTDGSRPPGWLVPAAIGLGSTVLVLWRPGITPDHPWADRRLVTVVLPTVVLAALAGVAWAVRRLRRRAPAGLFPTAAVLGGAALLVPAWWATAAVAGVATERGEPAAAASVCASLQPQDVVVTVNGGDDDGGGDRSTNEWPPVVRGVCGHPTLSLVADTTAERRAGLDRLDALTRATGHRLVVLAATDGDGGPPKHLLDLGLEPQRVAQLVTTEDPHLLDRRPAGAKSLLVEVWTAPASGSA